MPSGVQRIVRTVRYGPDGRQTITEEVIDDDGSFSPTDFDSGFGRLDINGPRRRPSGGAGRRYSVGWKPPTDGRRQSSMLAPMKLVGTSYEEIKAQCLREGRLFQDPDFLTVNSSVYFSKTAARPFEWLRPKEINPNAEFIVGGASRFDVQQGKLGDCWLLAAVGCLSVFPDLLYRVVPQDQSFSDGYAGIFRFNFWQYGKWVEVLVDDRLPTYNGELIFMHSPEKNEFWTSLLEKAYAKLNGSYESLYGGTANEAMEDFTGGVTETFDLMKDPPKNLFQIMLKAHARESLMSCSIAGDPRIVEAPLTNGLIKGHAYSITDVKLIDVKTSRSAGKVPMVRVRNPWGNEKEWKGAWSDDSPEWKFIPEDERKKIGLVFSNDGEFWMSFDDFSRNFEQLELCNLSADSLTEEQAGQNKRRWELQTHEGAWIRRVNAGGCRNTMETYWTNPQYRFDVIDPDEDDDDNTGTVLIALTQCGRRKKRKEGQGDWLALGYGIYELKDGDDTRPLDLNFFRKNRPVNKPRDFCPSRDISGRHKLAPGKYVIVPSTFAPGEEGEFLLRIYTEKPVISKEIDEDTDFVAKPVTKPSADDSKSEKELREAFVKISGTALEIDAYQLQDILNDVYKKEFKFDGFSADTCRSLVAMKDVDRSGRLGYEEAKKLYKELCQWKTAFKNLDTTGSGTFRSFELRKAFNNIGVQLSNQTFNALVQRYSHKDGKIYFDDFIHCIARLSTMFDIYTSMSHGGSQALFNLDEFIQTTMYS